MNWPEPPPPPKAPPTFARFSFRLRPRLLLLLFLLTGMFLSPRSLRVCRDFTPIAPTGRAGDVWVPSSWFEEESKVDVREVRLWTGA